MLNTFDALAEFDNDNSESETSNPTNDNATVDLSSILNRINEIETKLNMVLNKTTEPPTNPTTESGGIATATTETTETTTTDETKESD